MQLWISDECPNCNNVSFIPAGNPDELPEDLSELSLEGIECYQCKHRWLPGAEPYEEYDESLPCSHGQQFCRLEDVNDPEQIEGYYDEGYYDK
jgi:hypothetical protein